MSAVVDDSVGLRLLSLGVHSVLLAVFFWIPGLSINRYADAGTLAGGLFQLLCIKEIMNRLAFDLDLDDTPLPCEYFDMIAGSGIGG